MQYGMIAVMNRDQAVQADADRSAEREAVANPQDAANEQLIGRLGAYIENCWQAAQQANQLPHQMMLEDLRQREGKYAEDKLQAIRKQGGSEIFMMLTNVKCRAAEGWIRDIMLPSGERPFTVKPTPVPKLPEESSGQIHQFVMQELAQAIQQGLYVTPQQVYERAREVYDMQLSKMREEAKIKAERMEDLIDDKLIEGDWYDAMLDMIPDLVALPAGIIKGPVVRKRKRLNWQTDPKTGQTTPVVTDEIMPVFYSPSPLDIFPAPDSKGPQDGYLFERIPMRRSAIYSMIGVPGYDEERIRTALDEYQRGLDLNITSDTERHDLEHTRNYQLSPDRSIDVLEFNGSVRGEWLLEWGIDAANVTDKDAEYEVVAWKIGRHIVRCVLNDDPLGQRPYNVAYFDSIKGQFWGRGLPRIIVDLQNMCNGCARALQNNMAIGSGPLTEVEVDRLADGEDVTQLSPWRLIQTRSNKNGTPGPAVRFTTPPLVADVLLKVYSYFSQAADNYSGIPSYEQGVNPTTGAAGTASGLSMLMNASSRQIKRVVGSVDDATEGCVNRTHIYIMLYEPNPEVYGDADIEARGTASLVGKEQQQVRRNEFLQTITNPVDSQIIGPEGRAEILRKMVSEFDMDPDAIVPNRDELMRRARAAMMQQIPQNPQAPAGAAQPPQAQALLPGGQTAGGAM